jgi:hypothetical protein
MIIPVFIPFPPLIAGANIALLSLISSSFLRDAQNIGAPAGFDGFVKTFRARREYAVIFA